MSRSTYVALLRGVNVGGRGRVAMAELRAMVEQLGFEDVHTLLQSGNLVFRGAAKTTAALERQLGAETERRIGVEVPYFLRTAAEWRAILEGNPYAREAKDDPGHLLVMLLGESPPAANVDALRAAIKGPEYLTVTERHAYVVYPDDIGHSKLTNVVIERKLGCSATGRNWTTACKLLELADG